ncbi:hypothetical protein FQR65_LT07835 [Abscondita terminalis]|nr:hypothetical protein FQR65_LT07835 [Abscondita terminalis]
MQSQRKSNHRAMMGCLILNGKRYPVYEGVNTIGRCITATVSLKSLDVSKQHAIIIIVNDNEHYLSDFQSFNGTFLKKSKLIPLALYKISKDSVIEFGNVTATYNKIPNNINRENNLDEFHSTQFATQSLYDANTQAMENEFTHSNSTVHVDQLDSYFDDDYSFDEISSQMINEVNKSNSPVFKVPTINDIPTQKLCGNSDVFNTANVLNINELQTQRVDDVVDPINSNNIEIQPVHERERCKTSVINDIPTQELCSNDQVSIATNHIDIHDLETQKIEEESFNIHNMETQKVDVASAVNTDNHLFDKVSSQMLCDNDDVPLAVNYIDIHTVETQNLDTILPDKEHISTINDMSTQILTTDGEQDNSALIFDETVVDTSVDKDTRVSININDVTPGSARHTPTSQDEIIFKPRKKVGVIESDTEINADDLQDSSKTLRSNGNSQSSQDEILLKQRKKICIIESDSEMDVGDPHNSTKVPGTTLGSNSNSETSQDEVILKPRKKINVIESDSEMDTGDPRNSAKATGPTLENKCNSETSTDEIIFKPRKKISVIESDTDTDVEDLDVPVKTSGTTLRSDSNKQISQVSRCSPEIEGLSDTIRRQSPILNNPFLNPQAVSKDDSGSDTDAEALENTINDKNAVLNSSVSKSHVLNHQESDSGSDTDIEGSDVTVKKPSQVFNIPISKAVILDRVNITAGGTESDSDTDDFVFNTQINNSSTNPKIDDSSNDEIIPGTQFLEEDILNDNHGGTRDFELNDVNTVGNQVVNSIDDMESLYLEATQSIRAQNSHTFSEPIQSALQNTTHSEELKIINQPQVSMLEQEKLARSQESVANETSKGKNFPIQDSVFLQATQPVLDVVRVPAVEDNIFDQPTQQMCSSQDVFMQPTQAIDSKHIPKRKNVPTQKLQLETNIDSQEAVFLEPTQPVVKPNSQLNLNDDVFVQPTQPLHVIEDKAVFEQPLSVNKDRENISNVEVDDVYMAATQPVLSVVTGVNTERDIEKRLESMFTSQAVVKSPAINEVESQLEVVFESQNVSYRGDVRNRPGNPLLNEFVGIKNIDSQGSENSSVTMCNETNEASNVRPSDDHNVGIKESGLSKNVTGPRKSGLSLQKRVKDTEDDYLDEYHFQSSLHEEEIPAIQGPSKSIDKEVEHSKTSKVSETNKKRKPDENNVKEDKSLQNFHQWKLRLNFHSQRE